MLAVHLAFSAVIVAALWYAYRAGGLSLSATLACTLLCAVQGGVFVAGFYRPLLHIRRGMRQMEENSRKGKGKPVSAHPGGTLEEDFFEMITRMQQEKEQDYSLQMLKKQAELNALQSQINPHFLYNALDSIRGQLLVQDMDIAADIIEALSRLFRYSINPKAVYNTLEQEIVNVEDYMRIIRYRFGDRYHLRVDVSGDSDEIWNCEIPKLTLQPIVENAINHGLEPKMEGDGTITIRVFLADGNLHIAIDDNGVGMPASVLDELNRRFGEGAPVQSAHGAGIALVNVNERIRLLYGADYGLHVNSMEGMGTEVHIAVPAHRSPVGSVIGKTQDSV